MRFPRFSTICLLAGAVSPAAAQPTHPNLSGTWKLNAAKSDLHASGISEFTLQIEQKDPSIHILKTVKSADGKETKMEFRCAIGGNACESGDSKISLWFDSGALVEMDAGADVIGKSTFKLAPGGKSMTVDVTHIVPAAEADTLVLEKL
jgi:hypothetical protein